MFSAKDGFNSMEFGITPYYLAEAHGDESIGAGEVFFDITVDRNNYLTPITMSYTAGAATGQINQSTYNTGINWTTELQYGGLERPYLYCIDRDSANNYYVGGSLYTSSDPSPVYEWYIGKFNSVGQRVWEAQEKFSYPVQSDSIDLIAVQDNDANVYAAANLGAAGGSTPLDAILNSYASGGSLNWSKQLTGCDKITGLATVGTNIYTVSSNYTTGGVQLTKWSTTPTAVWSRAITYTSHTLKGGPVAVDSSGNVYVGVYENLGGATDVWYLIKYNSSGTLQWQQVFDQVSAQPDAFTFDNSDNLYVACETYDTVPYDAWYAKITPAGAISWQFALQNTLSVTTPLACFPYSLHWVKGPPGGVNGILYSAVAKSDTWVVPNGGLRGYLFKIPDDNSITPGAYGEFTIATTSYTFSTSTLTSASLTQAFANSGATFNTLTTSQSPSGFRFEKTLL